MIKYLKQEGYKFVDGKDDLNHGEFYLENITYEKDLDLSVLGHISISRSEVYVLFLKELDGELFNTKLENIFNNSGVFGDVSANAEKQENGYNITIIFEIKGE